MTAQRHLRRGRSTKPLFLGLVALAFIFVATAGGLAQTILYSVTDLGTLPGGSYSWATGINNLGQVVGYSDSSNGTRAFLYSGGAMVDLGTLPSSSQSSATAINNNGQVVGNAFLGCGYDCAYYHAFLYSGGTMTDLGTLPDSSWSEANGINNNGQVVGNGFGNSDAFLYSGGSMTDLGALTPGGSAAYGINDFSQAVGYSTVNSPYDELDHAVLFNGGTITDLGTLPGGSTSVAYGINNAAQVIGKAADSNGNSHAFLYSGGTMLDLGTLPGYSQYVATGINNAGQVVGYAFSDGLGHAFLYNCGTMMDLNGLVPRNAGGLGSAAGINDSGQIACTVNFGHAVLLTPIGSIRITGINMITNTDVVLSFSTVSNFLHDIQSTTNLVSAAWSTIATSIQGSGLATNYTDAGGASVPQKFYRVYTHN